MTIKEQANNLLQYMIESRSLEVDVFEKTLCEYDGLVEGALDIARSAIYHEYLKVLRKQTKKFSLIQWIKNLLS